MAAGGERFPKKARLTRRSEFLNLSRGERKVHTSHFVVISKTNDKGANRLGITVSARVGKAVVRNRIKRLLREFFRRHRYEILPRRDIVIIARKGTEKLSLGELTQELAGALTHGGSRQR
jgi:ribonuclease P protein component